MNRLAILILSHLGVAVVGILLALIFRGSSADQSSQTTDDTPPSMPSSSDHPERVDGLDLRGPQSASEFRSAWNAIADLQLTTKERIATQRAMLAKWAEVDMEGAMMAVVGSDWGAPSGLSAARYNMKGPLASALEPAMAKDPDHAWEIITSDRLGLGASMLRHAWYSGVGSSDSARLAAALPEVSWREMDRVLRILQLNPGKDAEARKAIFAQLEKLPESQLSASQLLPFLEDIPNDELMAQLVSVEDFASRSGKILLLKYGSLNYKHLASNEMNPEQLKTLRADLDRLPTGAQGELLNEILTGFMPDDSESPFPTNAQSTVEILDLLMEKKQWEVIGKTQTWKIWQRAHGMTPEERAAWAVDLPKRPETIELFHRGVDTYIGQNMEKAWDWIQNFEGEWRDRAFSEYSQQALQTHKNYEESQRALDEISDPEFRKLAESWRPQWAKDRD